MNDVKQAPVSAELVEFMKDCLKNSWIFTKDRVKLKPVDDIPRELELDDKYEALYEKAKKELEEFLALSEEQQKEFVEKLENLKDEVRSWEIPKNLYFLKRNMIHYPSFCEDKIEDPVVLHKVRLHKVIEEHRETLAYVRKSLELRNIALREFWDYFDSLEVR